jgi:uncharacterized protein
MTQRDRDPLVALKKAKKNQSQSLVPNARLRSCPGPRPPFHTTGSYNQLMATLHQISAFLGARRIAVAGVSRNPHDFSRILFRELLRRGYDVVPVHPAAQEIEGHHAFVSVADIVPPVEAALLLTSPAATALVVRDCAQAGVSRVWMHRASGTGAVNPEAVAFCESNAIDVIAGECPFMFLPHAGFVHSLHGFFRKLAGGYPAESGEKTCQSAH